MPTFNALDPRRRGTLKGRKWSLCVGAGISIGLMPSWLELSRRLVNSALASGFTASAFDELARASGWGLDAWTQAALNACLSAGKTEADFVRLLELHLYEDLDSEARSAGVQEELLIALNAPPMLTRAQFDAVFNFLRTRYATASVHQVASSLASAASGSSSPRAILTFNYDTLLDTLIRMHQVERHNAGRDHWTVPGGLYKRVYGPLGQYRGLRPIYHLHGCITPRPTRPIARIPRDSREKLIAPEMAYSQLAGNAFTWPQTTFLHHANSDAMLFIGHSMSDPNLRRWLAWAMANRISEIERVSGSRSRPLPHLWLRTRPPSAEQARVFEESLVHLGVQIAWIDDWGEIGAAMDNLMAL